MTRIDGTAMNFDTDSGKVRVDMSQIEGALNIELINDLADQVIWKPVEGGTHFGGVKIVWRVNSVCTLMCSPR